MIQCDLCFWGWADKALSARWHVGQVEALQPNEDSPFLLGHLPPGRAQVLSSKAEGTFCSVLHAARHTCFLHTQRSSYTLCSCWTGPLVVVHCEL